MPYIKKTGQANEMARTKYPASQRGIFHPENYKEKQKDYRKPAMNSATAWISFSLIRSAMVRMVLLTSLER